MICAGVPRNPAKLSNELWTIRMSPGTTPTSMRPLFTSPGPNGCTIRAYLTRTPLSHAFMCRGKTRRGMARNASEIGCRNILLRSKRAFVGAAAPVYAPIVPARLSVQAASPQPVGPAAAQHADCELSPSATKRYTLATPGTGRRTMTLR